MSNPAAQPVEPEVVTVDTADGPMPAEWFAPAGPDAGETRATVVVCQEIFGVTDYIRRRCRDLAQLGYGVLAPRFYWRLAEGEVPLVHEADTQALEQAMGLAQRLDPEQSVADGIAAVAAARSQPAAVAAAGTRPGTDRVAVLGFCWGGAVAFGTAAGSDADALVSYYGSMLPGMLDLAPAVSCPSLHHFGAADSFIPAEQQARVREAVTAHGAQWQEHPGADHAFDNDIGPWFDAEASARAWAATTDFLTTRLPTS